MESLRKQIKNNKRGQLLIEAIIVLAISSILLPALFTGLIASRQGKAQSSQRIQAVALLKESEEIIRSVREKGWTSFAQNGTFHPIITGNAWALSSGSETINGFTRAISISDVRRDSNGNIVTSGGTIDPSTKKVDILISWGQPYASSVNSSLYVTRFLSNNALNKTSSSDFAGGNLVSTVVATDQGGEITLSPNNRAKWCSPELSNTTIDLPDGPPIAVSASASASINTPNDVFVATAPFATTSGKMAYLTVTANAETPVATNKGIFTLDSSRYSSVGLVPTGTGIDNNFRTNDIKYYKSPGGITYALIATTIPDHEILAIKVKNADGSDAYQDPTNKIYKYWTFFNTTQYGLSGSFDTGFMDPSAAATDTGGDNNGYDSNPTRAYTDNNSFAVDTNSGSGTGTNCTGTDKDRQRYYNYDLTIPSGATINGIQVRLDAKVDSTTGSPKICVQLSWDGGSNWTTAQSTGTLTTGESTYYLGGSTDTWGRTWSDTNFSNSNFRVRIINVASNTSRDFSLDWAAVKVYYSGGALSTNDQSPFGYGATSVAVLGDTGYATSGGYLYSFDLSNIDTKSTSNGLDMIGCRIELDGYDCQPGSGTDRKYNAGQTGTTWSDTTTPAHNDCSDGGNIELYADNDVYPVKVGSNSYVFVAVGAGTNPELDVVNVSTPPTSASTPAINNIACGRNDTSNTNAGWKVSDSIDFNTGSGTEEAANSVYANSAGTRAYISSNGTSDSKQFYVINTTNKSDIKFLSGTSTPTSGFYQGTGANGELYPRRSLTVLNGLRAVLVGKDGVANSNNAPEYQVLNIENESTPAFCGSVNFDQGFNDLTSVSEADGDNFVYMIANTILNELKIIQGGPDGSYLDSGTYISAPLDLGASMALNRLSASTSVPTNTTLQYQIAATSPVNGSCTNANYVFVGPDGTASSYFPASGGSIPLSGSTGFENPAQCVKYKAFLTTTDFNITPKLLDISLNYSP